MALCQKLFSLTAACILALLYVSGIELLPGPCVITFCIMQTFAVLSGLVERPQKGAEGGLEKGPALDKFAALAQTTCKFGTQIMTQHAASTQCAVGVVLFCALARSLRVAGFVGSPLQVVGSAFVCGGVGCLGYVAVVCGAQRQDKPVCDCQCWHEVTCLPDPYHPVFWSTMPCFSEPEAMEVNEMQKEESPMANLMVSHHFIEENFSKSILSEEAALDLLVDVEWRTLFAELPSDEDDC